MNQSRIELMENVPVKTAVIRLALPTMIAMAVQMIYNLTDTFFIGKTNDPILVAALSLASPLFMAVQAFGNLFGIGAASYISRKLGEKEYTEAKNASSVSFYSAVIVGIITTLLIFIYKEAILTLMGTSADTYAPTSDYLVVLSIFYVVLVVQVTLAGLIRSEGATKKAMIGMVVGIVTNIILDPIFILTFHMGTKGAAIATVIGACVGTIYFIIHLLSSDTLLSITPFHFKPSAKIYAETLKIGAPSTLSTLVMAFSMLLSNVLAASYGDHVVAGNGIYFRVNSICIMLVIGLAQGFQPFAGYNYGAKKYHRLVEGFKDTILYGTFISCFLAVIFFFFGRNIIAFFIDDAATVTAGTTLLKAFIICMPTFGVQMTLMVTFQSTGKAFKALLISLGRQCFIYIPLLFFLNSRYGFNGFVYAQPIADILTTILAALLAISFIRKLIEEDHKEQQRKKEFLKENPAQS